jgi:hypothetical protein
MLSRREVTSLRVRVHDLCSTMATSQCHTSGHWRSPPLVNSTYKVAVKTSLQRASLDHQLPFTHSISKPSPEQSSRPRKTDLLFQYAILIFRDDSDQIYSPCMQINMKFQTTHATALAAFAQTVFAQGLIEVEVRYSKEMVDVGNLDIHLATWEKIYAADGNARSLVTDDSYPTAGGECTTFADGPENNVKVTINGAWGRVDGLGPNDSREGIVASIVKVLEEIANPTGWDVFTNCYGTTWQESVPAFAAPPACGGVNPSVKPECSCGIGTAQCEFHSWGHKVPSVIKANLYRDGTLLADSLEINFGATKNPVDEGCGRAGEITKALVGFLPMPGPIFAEGISIFCGA